MEYDDAKLVIASIFVCFALLEVVTGRFLQRDKTTRKDVILDVMAATVIPGVALPFVLFSSAALAEYLFPGSENQWAHWPWWAMAGTLLVADDMTQYWWHRLSHTSWLYPLHRAHHSAAYLSVRVVYRNNLLYYAFLPGLWLSGILLYWGFTTAYVYYIIIKLLVIISAHSSVRWDAYLLKWRITQPLMWVLERTISTPTTHAAHHGLHEADGVTHYRGNYGNLLFFWDVLFGTAKITRKMPEAYGVEGLAPIHWTREVLWPKAEERLSEASSNT